MQRLATFALAGIFGALVLTAILLTAIQPAGAAPLHQRATASGVSQLGSTDLSAQRRPKRVRTQIRVTPRYPYRSTSSAYPVPYPIEYPGPNAVRQCVANYVQEFRPSGTVIVPRMRCGWTRAGG